MTTAYSPCPACHGGGMVLHPLYGSPSCPEPTVPCDHCAGEGLVSITTLDERRAA